MSEHPIDLSQLASVRDGTGHTIFSPSSSSMWLWCSGSLIPNLLMPDEAGEDAAYGTVAHDLTDYQLKTGKPPLHRLGDSEWIESGDWGFLITIDEEMLAFVQQCVDYCEWLPGDHFSERKVYYHGHTPLKNQGGTADHCVCTPGHMTITDHKFGKGVWVSAAEDTKDPRAIIDHVDGSVTINGNTQGLLYALGFFLEYDHIYHFETITIRIAQPRLDNFDEWTTTRDELLWFGTWVKGRSAAAWRLNAPRRPSPKACQWCKVKGDCAAFAAQQEAIMTAAFSDIVDDISIETMEDLKERLSDPLGGYELAMSKVGRLSTEEMATLYRYRRAAESWWNQLAQALFERAASGEKVPGFKLVESRSHRVFQKNADVGLMRAGLKPSEIFEHKMVSPAQAEILLRKVGVRAKDLPTVLQPLVYRPPGKATLAPVNDKRPELIDVSGFAFEDLGT